MAALSSTVQLPNLILEHQYSLEQIGFTFRATDNLLTDVTLPCGWQLREEPSALDQKRVTILDDEHITRVTMFFFLKFYDADVFVNIFSKKSGREYEEKKAEEAIRQVERDKINEERLKQIKTEEAELKQTILKSRHETWSQENCFGLYINKFSGYADSLGQIKEYKRYCIGFFPTEEMLTKAADLLRKDSIYHDVIFKGIQDFSEKEYGMYKMHNFFENPEYPRI